MSTQLIKGVLKKWAILKTDTNNKCKVLSNVASKGTLQVFFQQFWEKLQMSKLPDSYF